MHVEKDAARLAGGVGERALVSRDTGWVSRTRREGFKWRGERAEVKIGIVIPFVDRGKTNEAGVRFIKHLLVSKGPSRDRMRLASNPMTVSRSPTAPTSLSNAPMNEFCRYVSALTPSICSEGANVLPPQKTVLRWSVESLGDS